MEVAAGGIDAEGPSGEAGGLPGGEGKGVVEEARDGIMGEVLRRGEGGEERTVERRVVGLRGKVEKGEERGTQEAEKGIGLVGPVEAARAAGVPLRQRMLRPVMVVHSSGGEGRRQGGGIRLCLPPRLPTVAGRGSGQHDDQSFSAAAHGCNRQGEGRDAAGVHSFSTAIVPEIGRGS